MPSLYLSKAPSGEPTSSPSQDPSKEPSGLPSLEPSKYQITAIPCGLVTTCDSGILDDCSGQEECKTFETAEYCVEPNPAPYPNACTDDCNCLGTYHGHEGYWMACGNYLKYNEYSGENDVNTRVVKYYTETCYEGECRSWTYNDYGEEEYHIRILNSLRIPNEIERECPMNCDEFINDFCPCDVSPPGPNSDCYFYCDIACN